MRQRIKDNIVIYTLRENAKPITDNIIYQIENTDKIRNCRGSKVLYEITLNEKDNYTFFIYPNEIHIYINDYFFLVEI